MVITLCHQGNYEISDGGKLCGFYSASLYSSGNLWKTNYRFRSKWCAKDRRPEAGFLVNFGVEIFRAVMKFYCCLNFDADLGKLESKYFVEYQFDVLRCAVP